MKKRTRLIQQNKRYADYLGMGVLGGLMAFALSSAVVQYIDLDPWMMFSYMRIIISVFFTMSVCIVLFRNWKTMAIGGAVILIGITIFSIIWARGGFSEEFYLGTADYMKWLGEFIFNWQESMELPWLYSYITVTGVSALLTILIYFLIVKWFIFPPVFLMTTTLFVAQWAIVREVNKPAFYLSFSLIIILYIVTVFRDKLRRINKKGEGQKLMTTGRLIAVASPVVAILLVIVLVIPKSGEPIKWEWLDQKLKYRNTGGDKPIDFNAYDEFNLSQTGFTYEPGTPGGSATLDFSHVLDVYSQELLYLRGESWPYFDGTSWGGSSSTENYSEPVVSYEDYDANRRMLLEPIYGWRFMDLDRWFLEEYGDFNGYKRLPGADFDSVMGVHLLPSWYNVEKAEVVYAGVETKTLFVPMYSEFESIIGLNDPLAEHDDTLEASRPVSLFTTLFFDYLSPEPDNELFIEYLRRSNRGIYGRLLSSLIFIVDNLESYDNIWMSNSIIDTLQDLNDLYVLAEDYYWRYTALPEELPDRVTELAESITEPYDNNYDKVKALEDFFRQEFTYSLEADFKPEGREFTDWFIFDSRVGYCTFYATSMTTLVRSIGLPARYVEGFVTPPGPEPGSRYPVLNSNAHAWVEVYFEGIGWITFEPTPPFADLDTAEGNPALDPDFEDPALDENQNELDKDEDPFVPLPGGTTGGRNKFEIPRGWLIGAMILAALALFNLSITAGRRYLFKNIKNVRRFKIGYFEILRILAIRGILLKKGMTLMELADSVDDQYYAASFNMKNVTAVYYKIVYGGVVPEENELRILGEYYQNFRYELSNELKLWEWLLFRLLLPIL